VEPVARIGSATCLIVSTPIFNREEFQHPSDGWYQIEAKGEHPNNAAGVVQVIDDAAIKSIVDSFNADAKAGALRNGSEMLVDIEHFKDDPSKETRAYGWLQELQARPDGIYGRIKWTATGQAAVDGGDYRFFSTEYDPKDLETVNNRNPKSVRPLRLDGLTLTNMNNNRGQRPITNRAMSGEATTDLPHQSEVEPGYPAPALEAWFHAVKAMSHAAHQQGGLALSYQQAFNLTKRQHPDMYRAAFGDLNADPYADTPEAQEPDADDAKSASDAVANITNRIRRDSGWTFQQSWNFARSLAPKLFNRAARLSSPIANRQAQPARTDEQRRVDEDRQRAALYFQKLVTEEKAQCGGNFQLAYSHVRNRETALDAIVCGRLTGAQVFPVRPDLFKKIYNL